MRASDYQERRRAYWIGQGLAPRLAERRAVDDQRAAEDAGVRWDPEELPLLGRLSLRQNGTTMWIIPADQEDEEDVWIVAQLELRPGLPDNRSATLRAMVELWNEALAITGAAS